MCEKIVLSSSFAREDAHEFYKRNNFEKVGYMFKKVYKNIINMIE